MLSKKYQIISSKKFTTSLFISAKTPNWISHSSRFHCCARWECCEFFFSLPSGLGCYLACYTAAAKNREQNATWEILSFPVLVVCRPHTWHIFLSCCHFSLLSLTSLFINFVRFNNFSPLFTYVRHACVWVHDLLWVECFLSPLSSWRKIKSFNSTRDDEASNFSSHVKRKLILFVVKKIWKREWD